MVRIYTPREIARIKDSGKLLRETFEYIKRYIEPGITTKKLDSMVYKYLTKKGGYPAFLGFDGYPASICVSINDEVIHGMPDQQKTLKQGDIVSLDIGVRYKGFISDSAYTFPVGKISADAEKLIKVTYNALYKGIQQAVSGNRIGDIGHAIESYVKDFSYSVVTAFVGHGVGEQLHEDPAVPNYGKPHTGIRLKKGMVLAIEPMINSGTADVILHENGWTALTADHKLSAHFEHTVAVQDQQAEILTI
ncbi:MAG: type I methionyl aminopeptidase [Spirochaetes bacterium]|nr:type I methionyl aminopeptidase [Spirochaetota bacterium]